MAILTYLQVHAYYNIPPLILLALLYKPFTTAGDLRKFLFLVVIAVLYTTPWDNYIIWRNAWQYCPTCVMGTIGLVPVEEYIFFVTQTLLTCLIHSLITRCFVGLPALGVRSDKRISAISSTVLVGVLGIAILLLRNSWYDLKTFYIRAILLWTTPVLVFLFSITGIFTSFMFHRLGATVVAISIPTVYLWIVDSIAIRSGTWHINEATSLETFLWHGLPIEEAIFFLVTNLMVVLGCNGFDLAFSIVHTYDRTLDFSFASLCRALLRHRDESVVSDLAACVEVLKNSSSSFYTSSFFFNESVRRDLIVLYAFCRYTDDITDNTDVDASTRSARLAELTAFITKDFLPRDRLHQARHKDEAEITRNSNPVQRSMLRYIAHKVPQEPLLELLRGYEWDLQLDTSHDRRIRFEEDLITYSRHVASSVAEMCVYVVDARPDQAVLLAAREMGVVLQLTNVARDILTDALHQRTYVPEAWFHGDDRQLLLEIAKTKSAKDIAQDFKIQALHLETYAIRLLEMAQSMHKRSTGAISKLPADSQIGIRIATDGYFAIGRQLLDICQQDVYPIRARVSRMARLRLAIHHLYKPEKLGILLLGGCGLRFILLMYGNWQDSLGGNVKFTDIDYNVFSDAAKFMQAGESPYARATYRYTPILAWLLIPNQYLANWGKIVFSAGDILAGWLMIKLLKRRNLPIGWSAIWLLNPMVAIISTRGNCESLLGALAIALLYSVETGHIVIAGLILGSAVHFKIYPIIYAPSIIWALESPTDLPLGLKNRIWSFLNTKRIVFAVVSSLTFASLSGLMFYCYGMDFVQHTFLYHISRSDHRHNFSVYHLLLYLSSAPSVDLGLSEHAALLAFLPQTLLSFLIIPLSLAKMDLTACFFAQTFAFVTFNKVVTSQYFMWYLVFLPLYLPRSKFLSRTGLVALILWIASQALWLYFAYGFEILGRNTFLEMWMATILFFSVNIFILGKVVGDGG